MKMKDVLLYSTQVRILTKVVSVLTSQKFGLKWFHRPEAQRSLWNQDLQPSGGKGEGGGMTILLRILTRPPRNSYVLTREVATLRLSDCHSLKLR